MIADYFSRIKAITIFCVQNEKYLHVKPSCMFAYSKHCVNRSYEKEAGQIIIAKNTLCKQL